jgi:hypothetical protein
MARLGVLVPPRRACADSFVVCTMQVCHSNRSASEGVSWTSVAKVDVRDTCIQGFGVPASLRATVIP